ncbi:hypothetical protein N341_04115, partial [Tyto alba]
RANVYPTREFLARGRQETHVRSCRHCGAEIESCLHIIGYCPAVQDARIKRHNQICELLIEEAKKKEWIAFQEPLIRDEKKELFKPNLVLVREEISIVVDVTIRYESKETSLEDAAKEKIKKYQHLEDHIQELTNTTTIKFMGFPLGARGKWYQGNYNLLKELGLSGSRQDKVARRLSNRALFSSVDSIHMFSSKVRTVEN